MESDRWRWSVLVVGLVVARGAVASEDGAKTDHRRHAAVVVCEVEGLTTVLWVRPSGSLVKAGDLVCELDPSRVKERLARQSTLVEQAERDLRQAALHRESAEIALAEHEELALQERGQSRRESALAAAAVDLARARLDEARRSGTADPDAVARAGREVARAEATSADRRRRAVDVETRVIPLRAREREADLKQAREVERSKASALEAARARLVAVERQLRHCRVVAPADGRLVHARWRSSGERQNQRYEVVETGALVRQNQVLFRVVPGAPAPSVDP